MEWMRFVWWPKASKTCYIDKLSPEILGLILEALRPNYGDAENLLGLCLVSRRMYLFTIPYLYRVVHIDLARASHLRLLQRLIKPRSRLPERIRRLTISGTQKTTDVRLLDLYVLCSRLTLLQSFDWRGSSEVPQDILDTLATRFPHARFLIDASHSGLGQDQLATQSLHATLLHPASTQLSSFSFKSSTSDLLYSKFKRDLICMLQRNPQLECLRLDIVDDHVQDCPEMLGLLRSGSLPKVTTLALRTSLFTNREIQLCGTRGMFERLGNLRVGRSPHLSLICASTVNLREVTIFPALHFNDLEAGLDCGPENEKSPLSSVRVLHYQNYSSTFVRNRQSVPWYLLKRMPKLQTLALFPFLIDGIADGVRLDSTAVRDLAGVRKLCPDIQELAINIPLRTRFALWPMDLLEELAMFKRANILHISLLTPHPETTVLFHCLRCVAVYEHILKRRRATYGWCKDRLKISFNLIRERSVIDHVRAESVVVWTDKKRGFTRSHHVVRKNKRADLDKMTSKQLQEHGKMCSLARRLGWDCKGHGEEVKRRERTAGPVIGLEPNATLWDSWTSGHARESQCRPL